MQPRFLSFLFINFSIGVKSASLRSPKVNDFKKLGALTAPWQKLSLPVEKQVLPCRACALGLHCATERLSEFTVSRTAPRSFHLSSEPALTRVSILARSARNARIESQKVQKS